MIIKFQGILQMTYPDIKAAGPDTLRNTSSINSGANDVQESHKNDPAKCSIVEGMRQAVCDHKVSRRNHATQAQSNKETFT